MNDGKKDYDIEIDDHGTYLHAVVGGLRVTAEAALGYWQEIVDKCDETGCSKILLEHNFVEMISMQEMLEVIGPVGELLKGKSMAFFDRYGNYDIPEAGKVILRGHDVKMQLFHDINEAKRWLLAN